ncbi:hypothetical protein K1719_040247 [Acacia pycnantha]|nr:hypothetical protein K1719_040247 [Acacia pycnantha]
MKSFPEDYTFWGVHGEKPRMRYDDHLSRSSQEGIQVDQDYAVNDVVRDMFGFQDYNFTAEVQGADPVFLRNEAAREFFSLMDEADRPLYQGNVNVARIIISR